MQFDLHDGRRSARLLVASISDAASRQEHHHPLALLRAGARFPGALVSHINGNLLNRNTHQTLKQRAGAKQGSIRGPDIASAGAEAQRMVAIVGGVLLAGLTKAARQVANSRPGAGRRQLAFHRSFKLPWEDRNSSIRCAGQFMCERAYKHA